jgi:hypothetical protein
MMISPLQVFGNQKNNVYEYDERRRTIGDLLFSVCVCGIDDKFDDFDLVYYILDSVGMCVQG